MRLPVWSACSRRDIAITAGIYDDLRLERYPPGLGFGQDASHSPLLHHRSGEPGVEQQMDASLLA